MLKFTKNLNSDLDRLAPEPMLLTNTAVLSLLGQHSSRGQKGRKEKDFNPVQEETSRSLEVSKRRVNALEIMRTLPGRVVTVRFTRSGMLGQDPLHCVRG